ncbi:nucleotidyltransferase domain-containing protein, partial [Candidatus Bathyarchaeota archaeon]|nr:nucleotidyltransferase domain-containing protein [Candidatus Bathyarchaeota archaeon]
MSHEILVKNALRKREVFRNLKKYLRVIKGVVRKLDSEAEVYLFGSVVEKRYNYSSDIDVLVVTRVNPADV